MKRIVSIIAILLFSLSAYAVDISNKKIAIKTFLDDKVFILDSEKVRKQGLQNGTDILQYADWKTSKLLYECIVTNLKTYQGVSISEFREVDRLPAIYRGDRDRLRSILADIHSEADYILLVYQGGKNLNAFRLPYRVYGNGFVTGTQNTWIFAATHYLLFDTRQKLFLVDENVEDSDTNPVERFLLPAEQQKFIKFNFKEFNAEQLAKLTDIVNQQPINFENIETLYRSAFDLSDTVDEELDFIRRDLDLIRRSVTLEIKQYRQSEIEALGKAFNHNVLETCSRSTFDSMLDTEN